MKHQTSLETKHDALTSALDAPAQVTRMQRQPSRPLSLQRAIGNHGLGRILAPKLEINEPGDTYEQEADRVADQVMRMPAPPHQALEFSSLVSVNTPAQRKCSCAGGVSCPKCEEEEHLQRQAAPSADSMSADTVPSSVGKLGSGQRLNPAIRSFFEPRFGRDLSQVRVHTNTEAAQSARAVNALAYTQGPNVVFGEGQYQPSSPSGLRLFAHELTHVTQQGYAAPLESKTNDNSMQVPSGFIQRNEVPSAPQPSQAVTPETLIQQWLDQHQFAPPVSQPEKEEPHVLLNGEDMTISDAVKLAADALKQPPELVKSVITAQLALPIAKSASDLPFIGGNNEIPGINLTTGKRDAFGVNIALGKTVELSTIDDYLTEHGFATPEVRDPTATRVLFDGKETTVDDVAAKAMAILGQYPLLKKADVVAHIRQKYVQARGGAGNQIVFGYTLVPKFAQFVGGTADPLNPLRTQHQFSFTVTRQHHANDSPGLETSFQGSVTLTDKGIANIQAGGQEAVVKPLLEGWIQVSGLIQAMVSANWNKDASGSTVISPAFQATGGGQVLVTPTFRAGDYKFLNGHVQFGVQALAGIQATSSGVVPVANVGLVLNIPFSL